VIESSRLKLLEVEGKLPIEATRSGRKTAHRVDLVESCARTIEAVITANNRPDNATIRRRMISRVPILQLPAMYKSSDI